MGENPQGALRVALMARDCERGEFRALLEEAGIEVVVERGFELPLPADWCDAEVLLIDLEAQPERQQVEHILRDSPVPVLLNAGGVGSSMIWHRRLVGKLQSLANRTVLPVPPNTSRRPALHLVGDSQQRDSTPHWVVVLGASIGGPRAIVRFLQALPCDLPLTILLAQHISESLQGLLVEQLDRCSRWPVALLGDSQALEPGQVWLVPADTRIELDEKGTARRCDSGWPSAQRPDIDDLLRSVADAFGEHCGAILFSGLGKDGVDGCQEVSLRGGFIWTQSAQSCVISNMPDAARKYCKVERSGSPEELALALAERCQPAPARIN